MRDDTLGLYNTADLREAARRRLPKGLFEFMDRGNDDELAVRDNRIALDSIKLKPRVLVDVSKRSQEISLFGKKQQMPVIVAPTGSAGLAWYEGEIALARAAAARRCMPPLNSAGYLLAAYKGKPTKLIFNKPSACRKVGGSVVNSSMGNCTFSSTVMAENSALC